MIGCLAACHELLTLPRLQKTFQLSFSSPSVPSTVTEQGRGGMWAQRNNDVSEAGDIDERGLSPSAFRLSLEEPLLFLLSITF